MAAIWVLFILHNNENFWFFFFLCRSWECWRLTVLWALPIPAFYTHTHRVSLICQWSRAYLDGPGSLGMCLLHPPQAFPEERQLIGKNYVALRVVALWCGLLCEASQTHCKRWKGLQSLEPTGQMFVLSILRWRVLKVVVVVPSLLHN